MPLSRRFLFSPFPSLSSPTAPPSRLPKPLIFSPWLIIQHSKSTIKHRPPRRPSPPPLHNLTQGHLAKCPSVARSRRAPIARRFFFLLYLPTHRLPQNIGPQNSFSDIPTFLGMLEYFSVRHQAHRRPHHRLKSPLLSIQNSPFNAGPRGGLPPPALLPWVPGQKSDRRGCHSTQRTTYHAVFRAPPKGTSGGCGGEQLAHGG